MRLGASLGLRLCLALCGRHRRFKCGRGRNLAGKGEFEQQKQLAQEMLDWYAQYVVLLRRLLSGNTPRVLHAFAGAGAAAEGSRRAGMSCYGMDLHEQPDFRARFG